MMYSHNHYHFCISYNTMIRNYYESLGLTRNATTEEIAENYRKLALRYHPKTTKQSQDVAAQMFSELAEAYEVLSDPVKRAYFDKFGIEKLKEGFYEQGQLRGGYRYASNPHEIFQQFFKNQQVLGNVLDLKLNTEGSMFGHAFGGLQNKETFSCEHLVVKVPCTLQELYKGATKTVKYERKVLSSDGRSTNIAGQQKTLHIKPGYHSGTAIHIEGGGHQTVHRTVSDLFFAITEIPHPFYQRKGDDLIYTHNLWLYQALECKTIELTTLDGRHLNVGIDEIITPQMLHEVVGEGLVNQKTGKRGNLYIKFNIHFPTSLSETAKKELSTLLS